MRSFIRPVFFVLIAISFHISGISSASAKCTRLAFSVNDYGKIEPAADAKRLLDGYIAKWTGDRGITGYKTGKKSVDCKLFLDFIVFDEYTCRAEASVCWNEEASAPALRPAQATQPSITKNKPAQTAQSNAPAVRAKVKAAPARVQPRSQSGYGSVYEAN